MWERWNSIQPDLTFGPVDMNSFNHYAYGAVGDWMFGNLGGIQAVEPGYKTSRIAPLVGYGGLTHASCSQETAFGRLATDWSVSGGTCVLTVEIPVNTTASVVVPAKTGTTVFEGAVPAETAPGVQYLGMTNAAAVSLVGSGHYGFTSTPESGTPILPPVLAHRYSFSETSGTSCADSVGGAAWNGTLPRGGVFTNGQLVVSSSSQQYVKLPAGILGNYTAVTVEAWVTFPNQLPVNCFFFGFGNTNGSSGVNYIFCAPRAGRIAITSSNYSGEQNAYGNLDFSFHSNLHVTAVFNPPLGTIALYTNGVLAGINNAVTTPMSAVSDVCSFIGRSLYSPDPYPDFTLDEFRIYSGALSGDEIAALQALGPGQPLATNSPTISAAIASGSLTFTWPLESAGFTLQSRTNLILGDWANIVSPLPQIIGNQWQIALPMSGSEQFVRLQK